MRLRRPSSMVSASHDGINCDRELLLDQLLGDRA